MEYRKVNDEALRADIVRQDARSREHDAFLAEVEAERHRRLTKVDDPGVAEAAKLQVEGRTSEAQKLRSIADARIEAAKLTPYEVAAIHYDALDGYIEALEREHIAKKTKLELVQGRDKEAKDERAMLRAELAVIESAHEVAVEMFDDAAATLGEDYPEHPEEDRPMTP